MSITINYKNKSLKNNSSNLVLFTDKKFDLAKLKKHISSFEYSFISDLLKTRELDKKILVFDLNSKRRIILVSLEKNLTSSEVENLGAKFYELSKDNKKIIFELSAFLETKLTEIDGLVLNAEQAIGKLNEYSTSLISAAVTGKIADATVLCVERIPKKRDGHGVPRE